MSESETTITFGIIVLNGEPFTRYTFRALYPHAHEIIIVEGASPGGRYVADKDGHSNDGTLDILRKLKKNEDPEDKLIIVTAEDEGYPTGFWPGEKDEQSRAYAKRATGDYLWQVDSDEFYKDKDIKTVKRLLEQDSTISAVSFKQKQFWGGFDYLVDSWYLKRGGEEFHRLFKWEKGYEYVTHRPPTVYDAEGIDTRKGNWLRAEDTAAMGICLYHYSFVFPKQVFEKASYYKHADWARRDKADWWANEVFMKLSDPFSVFSVYWDTSWLKRFKGEHPGQIQQMMEDINNGDLSIEIRRTDDIKKLLQKPSYKLKVVWYRFLNPIDEWGVWMWKVLKNKLRKIFHANRPS